MFAVIFLIINVQTPRIIGLIPYTLGAPQIQDAMQLINITNVSGFVLCTFLSSWPQGLSENRVLHYQKSL